MKLYVELTEYKGKRNSLMNNGYEYYYLFGLDIPLEKYGLGKIKQPKIKDFLSKDIGIDSFFYPFVMNDIVIGQTKEKDSVLKLKESMGDLTFLLVNCLQSNRNDMLFAIKQSLEFLYDEEVEITDKFTIQIGEVEINNSNFKILCDVVLEMLKIDKSKLKFNKPVKKEMSEIEKEFERRRKEYEKRVGKQKNEKDLTILDMVNVLVHTSNFKYEDVLSITLYQLKNSFDVLTKKDNYETTVMYMVSPKFEIKDKQEHWVEKIKINKSTLSRND